MSVAVVVEDEEDTRLAREWLREDAVDCNCDCRLELGL